MPTAKPKKTSVAKPRRTSAGGAIKVKRSKASAVAPASHVIDLKNHPLVAVPARPLLVEPEAEPTMPDSTSLSAAPAEPRGEPEFAVKPRRARPSLTEAGVDSPHSYKKIAIIFLSLSALCLAAAAYVSFVTLDIIIAAEPQAIEADAVFAVYDRPETYELPENSALGLVRDMEVELSREFTATGQAVGQAEVSGLVTIVNNYSQSQPLIATTRLLSPNNQLLRLRSTVTVPAGGSVEVEVYSDEVDPSFILPASRLTIPGLWAGLQSQIYAEVETGAVVYRGQTVSVVTEADITNAIASGKGELVRKAREEIETAYGSYDERLYEVDESAITYATSAKAGDQAEEFTIDFSGPVTVVAFNTADIQDDLDVALYSSAAAGREISQPGPVAFSLLSADTGDNVAQVKAVISADASLNPAVDMIDRSMLVNLRRDQIEAYLEAQPWISSYELVFRPSFWNISPALADKIRISQK